MRGRKKSDDTRTAILRCAGDVFSKHEFHEVLTADIAHHLGIGKGTIYRYFGSKEALYLATIADGLDGLHAAVTGVLQQDATLETTIEALVRTMIGYFWQQRDFFVLMARLEPKLKPRQRADWRERRSEVVTMVRKRLERAAARGEIARSNFRLAVEVLFGMIRGVCVYRTESDRPEELTRLVTALFLHGLRGARLAAHRPRPLAVVQGGTHRS
jgi:AcrR family transcriptional regulator